MNISEVTVVISGEEALSEEALNKIVKRIENVFKDEESCPQVKFVFRWGR